MKIGYYGYCILEKSSGTRTLMPFSKFIRTFCSYENPKYKNQFTHGGEYVFLLHAIGDLYLFVQTRSNELIKKINYENISVAEIYDLLGTGEMIGFASYVHMADSYIGFASTMLAPRVSSFAEFINKILASVGADKYQFVLIPLLHQVSKADAISMPFIGKSTIQVNKSNSLFDDFVSFVGGKAGDFDDVDSFEITIRPRDRKDISKAVSKVISTVPDDGLEKLIIKAKENFKESLVDMYLVGKGLLSDKINTKDEKVIAQKIRERIDSNQLLKSKVSAHEQDESFSKDSIDCISNFNHATAWSAAFSDL